MRCYYLTLFNVMDSANIDDTKRGHGFNNMACQIVSIEVSSHQQPHYVHCNLTLCILTLICLQDKMEMLCSVRGTVWHYSVLV